MRLALISVSTEQEVGHGPSGLLPLFDGTVVERQVQSVQNMGAKKIILLSPTMHGSLLQYADSLKLRNIDAEIIRNAGDLQQYASDKDDLIFLGDGILLGDSLERDLLERSEELIYAVANAEIYSDFERIDLGHRWLGIALLRASRLEEICQIPDDWDIGSALLRTAVQLECARELVSDEDMQADSVAQLFNYETSQAYADRQLSELRIPGQNFLDRYVIWPLTRKAMPLLWQAPDAKKYTGMVSIISGLIAMGLSVFVWPVASLAILFAGSLALMLYNRISIFSTKYGAFDLVSLLFYLFAAMTLTITVVRNAQASALFAEMALLVILFGNLWIVSRTSDSNRLGGIRPDIYLVLLGLLIAGAFGFFSIGLYIAAISSMAYLVAASVGRFAGESAVVRPK